MTSTAEHPARPSGSTGPSGPSSQARDVALDLGAFVTASPSSYHAVAEAARRLEAV